MSLLEYSSTRDSFSWKWRRGGSTKNAGPENNDLIDERSTDMTGKLGQGISRVKHAGPENAW